MFIQARSCVEVSLLQKIEELVIDYYLNSGDFNGIPIAHIIEATSREFREVSSCISSAIQNNKLRIISSDHQMNPHIIREGFKEKEIQLKALESCKIHHMCVYPSKEFLEAKIPNDLHQGSPFMRKLAMGMGQLELAFFDLDLLELYRNDPRYYYECNDIGGTICIEDEHYKSENVDEKDKVLLKAFGLAYDDELNRYLAAFVGDIAILSPEHQVIWQSKIVNKPLNIHPDFYGSQILGRWAQHISIFDAVLHEQRIINSMADKMGKPNFFNKDFGKYLEGRPKEFAFMLRPSSHEYEGFIHLLDKLMSDNINKKFFKGDIELEDEIKRNDGRIQVIQKGTIVLLDQWLRKHHKTDNWEPWEFAISEFKDIRKQRQSPAHSINPNTYDPNLINKQRELMKDCLESLMIFRHALSTKPACKGHDFDIPEAIQERKIWTI